MHDSYSKINKITNYEDIFFLISKCDNKFSLHRNSIALENKFIAKCMLGHTKYFNYDEENIVGDANKDLINLIEHKKPEWYEEFKLEGVIKEKNLNN
jgi:hypothetical protein